MPSKAAQKPTEATNTTVTVAVVIAVVSAVLMVIVAKGLISDIQFNNRVLTAKTKAKKTLDANLAAIPTLINNYNSLGSRQQLIKDALPTEPDFPQIVSIMERMAVATGLKLKSVDPNSIASPGASAATTPGVSTTDPIPVGFSISIDSSYDKLIAMLKNIELSSRPMKVNAIQFSGNPQTMSSSIDITTFYQPPADVTDKMETIQ